MGSKSALGCLLLVATAAAGFPDDAPAHVILDSPNGGESLAGGSVFPVEWRVEIQHNTLDWDLSYSTDGLDGPWLEIASDLPVGDPTEGAQHSYDWTLPNEGIAAAWVRVRQDNAGMDYYGQSGDSFSIASSGLAGDYNGDGAVDAADYVLWREALSTGNLSADGNNDGSVNARDYDLWRQDFGGGAAAAATIPEPATATLLATLLAGSFAGPFLGRPARNA